MLWPCVCQNIALFALASWHSNTCSANGVSSSVYSANGKQWETCLETVISPFRTALVPELKYWDDFAQTISQYYLKGCIRTDSGY